MREEMAMTSTAPPEEQCVSVGEENYMARARAEAQRYIELIRKKLGPEPVGARLTIKSCPHDLGTYLDVVCVFDDQIDEAVEYAYRCESDGPSNWQDTEPPTAKAFTVTWYPALTLPVEAVSRHMAEVQGRRMFKDKAKGLGIQLSDLDFDEVVAHEVS